MHRDKEKWRQLTLHEACKIYRQPTWRLGIESLHIDVPPPCLCCVLRLRLGGLAGAPSSTEGTTHCLGLRLGLLGQNTV